MNSRFIYPRSSGSHIEGLIECAIEIILLKLVKVLVKERVPNSEFNMKSTWQHTLKLVRP